MPQGGTLKAKAPTKGGGTKHSSSQRSKGTPGHRTIAPKKSAKQAKLMKQVKRNTGSLTASLEKKLVDRAGYTELLKGSGAAGRKVGGRATDGAKKVKGK